MSNIVGEKFQKYVKGQIQVRQDLLGKGFNSATLKPQDQQLINNRNAWLKLASSVTIGGNRVTKDDDANKKKALTANRRSIQGQNAIFDSAGEQRLIDIGLTNTGGFTGVQLASDAVLFNTLSSLRGDSFRQRSGINPGKSIWNNSSYGLGGNEFGMVPAPGLISAKIDTKNRGSLRGAEIEIIANNKFQFELIELLYLRLGFTMMLEWGWDKYKANDGSYQQMGPTIIETDWFSDSPKTQLSMMQDINSMRKKYQGNYDGFFGKVSNFSWDFAPNGTYNITLQLISVGDVIESLKTKTVASVLTSTAIKKDIKAAYGDDNIIEDSTFYDAEKNQISKSFNINLEDITSDGGSTMISEAGSNQFAQRLYTDFLNKSLWENEKPSDYYNLAINYGEVQKYYDRSEKSFVYSNNSKYQYYMTIKQFLTYVEGIIIPNLKMRGAKPDKILKVDINDDMAICAAYPLQMSIDPRVCLVNPDFNYDIFISTPEEKREKSQYIVKPLFLTNRLKPFINKEELGGGTVMWGNILNIYLNYEHISKELKKSSDKKGNLNVFKFLQGVFDGVNVALGGQNNITVTLKDDVYITITEQNVIPGINRIPKFKDLVIQPEDPVDFNLYGFNRNDGKTKGNFVTDFSFETQITPDLASMITIGAAAGNSNIKNYDATAFSSWNNGLKDRYSLEYMDPSFIYGDARDLLRIKAYKLLTKEQVETLYNAFNNASIVEEVSEIFVDPTDNNNLNFTKPTEYSYSAAGATFNGRRNIPNSPVINKDVNKVSWDEYLEAANDHILTEKIKQSDNYLTTDEAYEEAEGNYLFYLVQAFGGKYIQRGEKLSLLPEKSYYVNMVDTQISNGKSLWSGFVNDFHQQIFIHTGQPSNTIGFIPLDLQITCDGISGVKIYNGINIDQQYLPPAYPKSLSFLISSLGHTISDNSWSTEMGTVSVPVIEPTGSYDGILNLQMVKDGFKVDERITNAVWDGRTPNATRFVRDSLQGGAFEFGSNESILQFKGANVDNIDEAIYVRDVGELGNGGDITRLTADVGEALFAELEDMTEGEWGGDNYRFRVTAGNDSYHQGISPNSKHTKGWKLDFTVTRIDKPTTANDIKWIEFCLKSLSDNFYEPIANYFDIIEWAEEEFYDGIYPFDNSVKTFRDDWSIEVRNEYNEANKVEATTGGHFDILIKDQTQQWNKELKKIEDIV